MLNTKWMPNVAGVLNIISGILSLLGSIFAGVLAILFFGPSYDSASGQQVSAVITFLVLFLPFFVFSILAITGGVFALRKRVWGLALAGSICSILTIWSWFMGITSVVLISLSKSEFEHPGPMFPRGVIPVGPPTDQSPH
jgi:peptidoglycan biosynthesis protein MviN/MurJ (putative lipid II flippase)